MFVQCGLIGDCDKSDKGADEGQMDMLISMRYHLRGPYERMIG